MTETCTMCGGEGWVCETHGTPWTASDADCCGGPGMPCPDCNDGPNPRFPAGTTEIWRARGESLN